MKKNFILLACMMFFASSGFAQNAKPEKGGKNPASPKLTAEVKATPSSNPKAESRVTLRVHGGNGGYQLLLDSDAESYGKYWAPQNQYPISGEEQDGYDNAEYKIPTYADPAYNTTNVINMNESGSVNIPSGTYDIGIMNPDPDGGLYSEGTIYIIELLGHTGDDFVRK